MLGLGMQEIIVIALIVLLLFGGKKIPELMKGLGKGVKSFKDGMKEEDIDNSKKEKSEEGGDDLLEPPGRAAVIADTHGSSHLCARHRSLRDEGLAVQHRAGTAE